MSLGMKVFAGSLVSSSKNCLKNRFGELSAEEIQDIKDNTGSVKTNKATKFGMRLFNGTYLFAL